MTEIDTSHMLAELQKQYQERKARALAVARRLDDVRVVRGWTADEWSLRTRDPQAAREYQGAITAPTGYKLLQGRAGREIIRDLATAAGCRAAWLEWGEGAIWQSQAAPHSKGAFR